MDLGVFAKVNQSIDEKIAAQLCAKYGFRFEVEKRERGAGVVTRRSGRSNWTSRTSRSS